MSDTDIFSLNSCYLSSDVSCNTVQYNEIKRLLGNSASCIGSTGLCTSDEMINIKNGLGLLQTAEDSSAKKRTFQLNTYFGKKYSAQNYIFKIIGIAVAIVAGLWGIGMYATFIPEWIITTLISITIGICSIIIIFKLTDMLNRSNFDYDQYNANIKNLPPIAPIGEAAAAAKGGQYSYGNFGKHCQDGECCPKFFSFNATSGYCSFNPFSPTMY